MSGAGFLLDTNVVSELRRKRPEPRVLQWFEQVDNRQLYLSGHIHHRRKLQKTSNFNININIINSLIY